MARGWRFGGVAASVGLAALLGCGFQKPAAPVNGVDQQENGLPVGGGRPEVGPAPPMPRQIRVPDVPGIRVEVVATGLEVPWDIAFLPGNRALVTERPGRVRLLENGRLRPRPYARIRALSLEEGGLMGIAVHPSYPNPPAIYLMYTFRRPDGGAVNRVSRFTDTGQGLTDERVLLDHLPAAQFHDGGILRFGPDGMLYIGTGDARRPELAQDRRSLAGKILRVTPEGEVPRDNPFPHSPVYALGLRNVQGLAWHPETRELWVTNHGPSGEWGLQARDSVYILPPGSNAGWPLVVGVARRRGIQDPILHYPEHAVPPAAALFYTGDLLPQLRGNFFFACLRSEHLQRVILRGPRGVARIERWWEQGVHRGRYGRLRGLVQGPDGAIYLTTSNRDGRGDPRPGDDKILRIVPAG